MPRPAHPTTSPRTRPGRADPTRCPVAAWLRVPRRAPPCLRRCDSGTAGRYRVWPTDAVGDHDGKPAGHHGRDAGFLVSEGQVEALGEVDALIEQPGRCALLAEPVWTGRERDQRTRTVAGPWVVRLEVGAGHRGRVPPAVGAA